MHHCRGPVRSRNVCANPWSRNQRSISRHFFLFLVRASHFTAPRRNIAVAGGVSLRPVRSGLVVRWRRGQKVYRHMADQKSAPRRRRIARFEPKPKRIHHSGDSLTTVSVSAPSAPRASFRAARDGLVRRHALIFSGGSRFVLSSPHAPFN